MNGGRLIGVGSDTCVFRPNIPCKNKKVKTNNKTISKVYLRSEKGLDEEINMNKLVSRIKGSKRWSITLYNKCEIESYDKILKYEPDIKKCLKDNKYESLDNDIMLYGDYGGISMNTRFDEIFYNDSNIISNFMKFMTNCKSLFEGLQSLHKHKIIHYDIKPGNITYDNGNFKYIDFGLSTKFTNKKIIERRSLNEFDTNRIYIYYPYDILYMYSNNYELYLEQYTSYRNNHKYIYDLNMDLFSRDINIEQESIIINMLNNEINRKMIIEKLDTYSLGITILSLLFNNFGMKLKKIFQMNKLLPYAELLRDMTEMDSNNRISAKDAYKRFNSL